MKVHIRDRVRDDNGTPKGCQEICIGESATITVDDSAPASVKSAIGRMLELLIIDIRKQEENDI